MNELIGAIGLTIFVSLTVFFANFPPKKQRKKLSIDDWDMIPVGVVYENQKEITPVVKSQAKSQSKVLDYSIELKKDCVNALVTLGSRKKDAKKTVEKIFETNHIESVEDFLLVAFQK